MVMPMPAKIAHLEMIQGVVNRLAHSSALLKGWSVVLVAALFALAAKDSAKHFALLAFLPAVVFWGLDGYYLWQERLFRNLGVPPVLWTVTGLQTPAAHGLVSRS